MGESAQLAPPDAKGLAALDRSRFAVDVAVPALRIPAKAAAAAMQSLRGSGLLSAPRIRSIVDDPSETSTRLLLLDPEIKAESIDDLPEKVREFAKEHNVSLTHHTLSLTYDHWTTDQIMRAILADSMEIPGAFETVGHIAHLNLRKQHDPYKNIIGQVILDKCKNIKTVVNKTDNIDHTFRFFQMEVLAGEDNMNATLKEGGCIFRFDFSKVYWNSRLQGEHNRIVNLFTPGDLVCDVFAGVGPYALPAAKNAGCVVFANDLNPQSHKYLVENIKLNKLEGRVRAYNLDGREFIHQALQDLSDDTIWSSITDAMSKKKPAASSTKSKKKQEGVKQDKEKSTDDGQTNGDKPATNDTAVVAAAPSAIDNFYEQAKMRPRLFRHYVMNLPATAIEFLGAFRGLLVGQRGLVPEDRLPIIHCHCFSRADDLKADVIQRVERALGAPLQDNLITVHNVRNVAPKKDMMCISFRLPAIVAFGEDENGGVLGKRKVEDNEHVD